MPIGCNTGEPGSMAAHSKEVEITIGQISDDQGDTFVLQWRDESGTKAWPSVDWDTTTVKGTVEGKEKREEQHFKPAIVVLMVMAQDQLIDMGDSLIGQVLAYFQPMPLVVAKVNDHRMLYRVGEGYAVLDNAICEGKQVCRYRDTTILKPLCDRVYISLQDQRGITMPYVDGVYLQTLGLDC